MKNIYTTLGLDTEIMFKMGVMAAQIYARYTCGRTIPARSIVGTINAQEGAPVVVAIDHLEYGYPTDYDAVISDPAVKAYSDDAVMVRRTWSIKREGVIYRIDLRFVAPFPEEEIQFLADCGVIQLTEQTYNTIACAL